MCCGKGGDLPKWEKGNITYLICTDIAEESVKECKKRYEMLYSKSVSPPFNAEFIVHDCTKKGLRKKYIFPSQKLDLVSCQFALHYGFESMQQAENMLKNASKNLKSGGYFIGTVPNESELLSRWYTTNGNEFGNNIYQVKFECNKLNPPFYGAKYHFYLKDAVDCAEFLVNSSVLQELALKYDLDFIVFKSFSDFYEKMKKVGEQLMYRMHVLHPPYNKNQNSFKRYGNNCQNRTLSQDEWDVITLYSVFVFKKK